MRNIYARVLLCVATGLWLVLLPVCSYGQKREHAQMLSRPVPSFRGENLTAIEALLRLAQEQHIPLGIDYLDATAVQKPITVSQAPANVADAIGAILANLRGYRWDLHNGVVHITHTVPRGERNLLDFVLPRFEIPRSSLQEASHELTMALDFALHPSLRGVAGDYSAGNSANAVGPWKLRNVTVRQVLDRIVSQAGNAAWSVTVPPGHLDQLPPSGLWIVLQYDQPLRGYLDLIRQDISGPRPVGR